MSLIQSNRAKEKTKRPGAQPGFGRGGGGLKMEKKNWHHLDDAYVKLMTSPK